MLADIEKAFLQINISPADSDVTRFLWYKNAATPERISGNLDTYRFCRVPFGVVSSPFLLQATLAHHLQKENTDTARAIKDNIYVDNVVMGVTTVAEGAQRYHGAKKLFSSASMNLREWSSNSSHLISQLPAHDVASSPTVKMLGLKWHLPSDSFYIPDSTPLQLQQVLTRQSALHTIASIYDPLGMFHLSHFMARSFFGRCGKLVDRGTRSYLDLLQINGTPQRNS